MKTIKLPPLVIDEQTSQLIHRLANGTNVSNLLRDWIRSGIQAHPNFSAENKDNLTSGDICVINKHGRPRKPASAVVAPSGTTCDCTGLTGDAGVAGTTPVS